jgi:chromosome partitioning protein
VKGYNKNMPHIIAVSNQKGGVGKTTTTVNVAAALTKDHTVLIVDLDPQGNATSGLGVAKSDGMITSYEVLLGQHKLDEAVQQTRISNLFILPTTQNLAGAEVELVEMQGREHTLKNALSLATYDFILIDCPPALGLLTLNALVAAHHVLIPVQTEYYALEGLGQLLSTIQAVRRQANPNLSLLGVVLTMYDKRTSLSENVAAEVKKHFGDKLFKSVIPRNVRLAEAPSYGRTVFEHDKWSKGARAYKNLSKELVKRV